MDTPASIEQDEGFQTRENFLQEALASWASYQETGLHLNEQEIRDWLTTWGTENETEVPLCHT
jgi:predicted transcriptional regulator